MSNRSSLSLYLAIIVLSCSFLSTGICGEVNDPNFPQQWALHNTGQAGGPADIDIDAPQGWDIERDASDIIVAVIDTGIDYNHPDLVDNMWTDANGDYGLNAFEL